MAGPMEYGKIISFRSRPCRLPETYSLGMDIVESMGPAMAIEAAGN
jgi:hypothetical protein